jgi:hypothetical protein
VACSVSVERFNKNMNPHQGFSSRRFSLSVISYDPVTNSALSFLPEQGW